MGRSLSNLPRATPRKMFATGIDPVSLRGETDRKFLAEEDIARVVRRTIEISGQPPKAFAELLGFRDQSPVSRWMAGLENASALSRIYSVKALRGSLLVAMAEDADAVNVQTQTVVYIGRRSA